VGPFFRISALRLEPGPPTGTLTAEARVGIITTKRLGNAVRRNRCRRRIRELHRSTRHLLAPGTWLVVIARSECATAPWADLETEWLRLLAKLSIVQRS
jgi:ribonuclease P protein component